MSALARGAAQVARVSRMPNASASTSRPLRRYATETALPSSSTGVSQADVVLARPQTSRAEQRDGTTMKKYTGKGFPMIPGLRHLVHPHHAHLHAGPPMRELTVPLRRKGGRNHTGQVVNRFVGGGHKRRLRIVDFYRLEAGIHDVVRIEYDPGRSAHIALIKRRGGSVEVDADEGARLAEMQSETGGVDTPEQLKERDEVKGGWSYILAPEGLRAGGTVVSYRSGFPRGLVEGWVERPSATPLSTDPEAPQSVSPPVPVPVPEEADTTNDSRSLGLLRTLTVKPGNVLPLYILPAGTVVHNLSLSTGGRMQLCRSAGSWAQVIAHHGPKGEALGGVDILKMGGGVDASGRREKKMGSVLVKLQSGEVRRFEPGCVATVGTVSNKEHHSRQIGKAGRSRWLGQKPRVRGVAMNACDHPHGGGRGKSKGNKHPRSVFGWLTRGKRTRRSKDRDGNKAVVSERPRSKDKQ